MKRRTLRKLMDAAERLFWTFVAAFLGALTGTAVLDLGVSSLDAAYMAGMGALVNAVLLIARWRLSVLPNPGEGLPALPTDQRGHVDLGWLGLLALVAGVVVLLLLGLDVIDITSN